MLVNMAGKVGIFRTMVIMTLGLEMFDVRIGCCEVVVGYGDLHRLDVPRWAI